MVDSYAWVSGVCGVGGWDRYDRFGWGRGTVGLKYLFLVMGFCMCITSFFFARGFFLFFYRVISCDWICRDSVSSILY